MDDEAERIMVVNMIEAMGNFFLEHPLCFVLVIVALCSLVLWSCTPPPESQQSKDERLIRAAYDGDLNEVIHLRKSGANIHCYDDVCLRDSARSAAFAAYVEDSERYEVQIEICLHLIEAGCKVENIKGDYDHGAFDSEWVYRQITRRLLNTKLDSDLSQPIATSNKVSRHKI